MNFDKSRLESEEEKQKRMCGRKVTAIPPKYGFLSCM